jgi:hypothetical protein
MYRCCGQVLRETLSAPVARHVRSNVLEKRRDSANASLFILMSISVASLRSDWYALLLQVVASSFARCSGSNVKHIFE